MELLNKKILKYGDWFIIIIKKMQYKVFLNTTESVLKSYMIL